MSTTEGKISPFHPFDPVDFAHPYEKLRQAREHCPVGTFPVEHVSVPFHFLAQDGDVRSSFHSPVLSNQGNFELSKDYPPVITQMDGAEHERLRTILETSFNAQIFKEARPFIVRKASQLIEEML